MNRSSKKLHEMKYSILTLLTILFLISCNKPECNNNNPIFDKYEIETFEYQTELIKKLQKYNSEDLKYWFDSYSNKNGKEYIIVEVQGEGLCAKIQLLITNTNKLENLIRNKGVSYEGAELRGLTYGILEKDSSIEIVYSDLVRIID